MENFGTNQAPMQLTSDDGQILQDARDARARAGAQFLTALFRLAFTMPHQLLSRLAAAPRLQRAPVSVGRRPLPGPR